MVTPAKFQEPGKAPRRRRGAIGSNFGVLGKGKRVFHVNPEITHCALNLAMTEKDLDGTKVAGRPIDDRCLRSAKRVRAILASHHADPCHPFIDEPGILAAAEMPIMINSAGKDIVVYRAAPPLKPSQQAGTGVREEFELNRTTCFLLRGDKQPKYDLVNAAIRKSLGETYSARLWANNILNEKYYSYIATSGASGTKYGPAAPKTYGVTLGVHF